MAIVPAVARRRTLTKALYGGGAAVHAVAFALQPTLYLKRQAMRRGFLGPSTVWTIVGVAVYGSSSFRKMVGKSTETLDVSRLGSERFMHLTTATPMSRRRRRKLAKRGVTVPTLKEQKAYGRLWAAKADAAKRAS
ncbi:hypothetical protein [Ilumatobacter sp.]|uniref:hypothetical protein n=1 Tax=Ilumatobacter sp. TaxID=1967498 RepID=UPI003AF72CC7